MKDLYLTLTQALQELCYSILRTLNLLYDLILCRFNSNTYVFLFNLRSIIIGNKTRISSQKKSYSISDSGKYTVKYFFTKEIQGSYAYKFGLKKQGEKLGKEYLLHKIDFEDNDNIFDCGANNGDFKLWFLFKNIEINYFAFEPSLDEYNCLKKNTYPSKCFNIALWNKNKIVSFFQSSQSADSSIIEPKYFEKKIKIKGRRLDQFINQKIKLLKLEGEGSELEIIEGAGDKIKLIKFITADLGFERGIKQESTFVPVTNYLFNKGFKLIAVNHKRCVALFENINY